MSFPCSLPSPLLLLQIGISSSQLRFCGDSAPKKKLIFVCCLRCFKGHQQHSMNDIPGVHKNFALLPFKLAYFNELSESVPIM